MKRLLPLLAALLLTACDSDSDPVPARHDGAVYFVDAPVQGLEYTTELQPLRRLSGPGGRIEIGAARNLVLWLGNLPLAITDPPRFFTPRELFPADLRAALNLTRLLLATDSDCRPANGLALSQAARDTAAAQPLSRADFSRPDFASTPSGQLAGQINPGCPLPDEQTASAHLNGTLAALSAGDVDADGVVDAQDNCPTVANSGQNAAACAPGATPAPASPTPGPTTAPSTAPSPTAGPSAPPATPTPSSSTQPTATPLPSPTPSRPAVVPPPSSAATPAPTATPRPSSTSSPTATPSPSASVSPSPTPAADDHADVSAAATPLQLGRLGSGTLETANDVDVFAVALERSQRYRVFLRPGSNAPLALQVSDDAGFERLLVSDGGNEARLDFSSAAAGARYFSISSPDGETGPYSLLILVSNTATHAEAHRFLRQASFGPDETSLREVMTRGIPAWLNAQRNAPSAYDSGSDTHESHLQRTITMATTLEPGGDWFPSNPHNPDEDSQGRHFRGDASRHIADYQMGAWYQNALDGADQLRQRMAYALSQILVVSALQDPLDRRTEAVAHYADIMARNALGSFRTLLSEVSRSPAMGFYLSHQGNEKANAERNTLPDENFARELMQLFTIGLYQTNLDGTPVLDDQGQLIPTYTQTDIEEMSRVMTGWDIRYNSRYAAGDGSYVHFMEFNPEFHDFGEKQVLGQTIAADLPNGADLERALEILFQHPNTAPFISRQLIQRLVTSNPSPGYVARVARVFENNGAGVRGDLGAVAQAILIDNEARDAAGLGIDEHGKVREHVLAYTQYLRAFDVEPLPGWLSPSELRGSRPVFDMYLIGAERSIGQGPYRARSVFNFYDADFVPQDSFFRGADPQRVLPELQLRAPNSIAGLVRSTNQLQDLLERNAIEARNGSVAAFVDEFNSNREGDPGWAAFRNLLLLDYSPALQAFEQGMENDSNGDFSLINDDSLDEDGRTPKQRGVHALLDFLELRMLGERPLAAAHRTTIVTLLDTGNGFNRHPSRAAEEALLVVSGAVQQVFLSPDYQILK